MSTNLPVPIDGPIVPIRNPEEFAAMLMANTWLNRIVADHREGAAYAAEADNEADDQFLFGQDFDAAPDVWELDQGYFDDEGLFGPSDLRDL